MKTQLYKNIILTFAAGLVAASCNSEQLPQPPPNVSILEGAQVPSQITLTPQAIPGTPKSEVGAPSGGYAPTGVQAKLNIDVKDGTKEVKVGNPTKKQFALMWTATAAVTVVFYFILKAFDTANLLVSTLSVATSFLAVYLTYLRSPLYACAYGANDIVLIALWIMASAQDISYLPMVFCFVAFLANDLYGFINWQRLQKTQNAKTE